MLTLIGAILLAVGLCDLAAAAVIGRSASGSGGLGGDAAAPPVVRLLRTMGIGTLVAGAVLLAVGLLS